MALRRTSLICLFLLPLLALACAAPALRAQAPRPSNFLAEHYDVSATIDTGGQSLSAVAKVDLRPAEASSNVRVELHPNLELREVKGADGKPLTFQRDNENHLFVLISLPGQVAAGSKVSLTFTYGGILANAENSPIPGIRAAFINKDGAYLLLPARWFPLTNFPSNRYTGTFRLNVPDTLAVAGTGKASNPTPLAGGRLLYTFECNRSAPNGTFVAGALQFNPKQAEGINVAVYGPPAAAKSAQDFANSVARSVTEFSDMFGPLPDPSMAVIQLPDGTLRDFAAPGVLLLSAHLWNPKSSDRILARLVASQWWGNQVLPATPADVWISDGLARYSEALYLEQNNGKEAGLRAVDEFAVGALMYEDAAPVSQAARLAPYSPDYRSVVMNKGAMIFHMLRAQMGDANFKSLLHDFYFRFAEKSASIEDFEKLAELRARASTKAGETPPNLRGFFTQWLSSTGVPEFAVSYVVYRTPKGFRIVGKVKQPLDTFLMPLDLRIDTEGNPETKTIEVVGTDTDFTVETFGRPKSGGIRVDPNNVILKGSTGLRSRAAIARGEELAEVGRYYDAVAQYQKALAIQPNRPLANFRMGEAFFFEKNYQAAANAFREALQTVPEPSEKWTEVWSHIYLGKIFDLLGQRERAVNEYSKAKQTNDDTGTAQQVAESFLKKPYSEEGTSAAAPATGADNPAVPAAPKKDDRPVLKKPSRFTDSNSLVAFSTPAQKPL
ncbi:MAG TPA: M1 family aminopeptidase [Candidatus Dormibacteraeota bacterium]|nr:M1 family aminopeptidase [Candidatus Dormibacteraeota bacterium]